jgi:hypothetical protein
VVELKKVVTVLHELPFLSCIAIVKAPTFENIAVALTLKLIRKLPLDTLDIDPLYEDKKSLPKGSNPTSTSSISSVATATPPVLMPNKMIHAKKIDNVRFM